MRNLYRWLVMGLFFFLSVDAFSQDDIILRNDNVTKGKVEEVGVSVIRYRKADNMDGPIYDMPKADVYMIVYANGSRDVINPRSGGDGPPPAETAAVAEGSIRVAPPEMPVYEQPACPFEGYLWTPGYWAYNIIGGYYWVPGVWVSPPHVGYLWTPGYWGYAGGVYGWNVGYWGEHIGFYGGVNYGYGYGGRGYDGGRWEGGAFRYNTAVSRVNVTVVHTTYEDRTVIHDHNVNRSSYNGGGGVRTEATADEHAHRNEDKPNGQHFNTEGHPAQHIATPLNNNQHNNGAINSGSHANSPSNNSAAPQQHTNNPSNNNAVQPQHNNNPANNGVQTHSNTAAPNGGQQHTSPSPQQPAQQHTQQPAQQQHAQPAQQQHAQPAQQQHAQPAPRPQTQSHPNNKH